MEMWEILVPVCSNDGVEYPTSVHRHWDKEVSEVSNGLTIFKKAKGEWFDSREEMIPVRFIATRKQAQEIAEYTLFYYSQEEVLCYKISNEIIRVKDNKKGAKSHAKV